jgi:hypothetical protein
MRLLLKCCTKTLANPIHIKKQGLVNTVRFSNRYLLRQRTLHLPAAYPRIDLASLTQKDPQRFWITGRLPLVYHTYHFHIPPDLVVKHRHPS